MRFARSKPQPCASSHIASKPYEGPLHKSNLIVAAYGAVGTKNSPIDQVVSRRARHRRSGKKTSRSRFAAVSVPWFRRARGECACRRVAAMTKGEHAAQMSVRSIGRCLRRRARI